MGKYRERPRVVEAIQWSGSNWHQMLAFVKWEGGVEIWPDRGGGVSFRGVNDEEVRAEEGQWIVRSPEGLFFVSGSVEFSEKYEEIVEEND